MEKIIKSEIKKYCSKSETFSGLYSYRATPLTSKNMKQKAEIIQDLEDQMILRLQRIKALQNEVDLLESTVSSLRELNEDGTSLTKEPIQEKNGLENYPGYPLNGTLLDKYRYFEDITLKVWTREEMILLIEKAEGKRQSAKTLKSSRQKTHYYIKTRELIKLKYNNKNNYSFFTTRPEWVERVENDGKIEFRLLSQHEPEPALLANLAEHLRKSNLITWTGIK